MKRDMLRSSARVGIGLIAAATLAWNATAFAQSATAPSPGAGFLAQEGFVASQPPPDVEPVYRGPTVDTLATIRKRGVLRVGVAISEPTVMHGADGSLIGYSIDLARQLAEDLGVQVEFVETSWSRIVSELVNRHFDLIASGLWVTVPRALVLNYTAPTAVEGIFVIANRSAAGEWKSVADLDRPGTRIAVYAGTSQERLAERRFPKATLIRVDGDADHFAPVLAGEAHAVLVPTFAPQAIVGAAPDRLVLAFEEPLSTSTTGFGVRKGDSDFVNFLNSWLEVRRADGWLRARSHYWAQLENWLK